MNSKKIAIGVIFCVLWSVNEILSIKVVENVAEVRQAPFTIDASQDNRKFAPTAPSSTNPTLEKYRQNQNYDPSNLGTEAHVKAQIFVADNQKIDTVSDMVLKNADIVVGQHSKEKSRSEKDKGDSTQHNKQQKWQIPSPISPLSITDPKPTNSSKRQIESFNQKTFIPSPALGPIHEDGFLPHQYHEAKGIPASTYLPAKPHKHDENFGYDDSKSGLVPPPRGLQDFENDFHDLRTKYPELDDLVSNYPIMEEIMKQKLTERFKLNGNFNQIKYDVNENNFNSDGSSEEKFNVNNQKYSSNEHSQEYVVHLKFPQNSGEITKLKDNLKVNFPSNPHGNGHPYSFEVHRPNWSSDKRPGRDEAFISTSEVPYVVPAGEYYQEPRFPITSYIHDDGKTFTEPKHPIFIDSKQKKSISPWKRIIHVLTAFLPVGILLSALAPNVININNTSDKYYPVRQRSMDDAPSDHPKHLTNPLVDLLSGFEEAAARDDGRDPACDDRDFCELSRSGEGRDILTLEGIFWRIAHETPEHIAEKAGMKKLFKAVRSGDCSEFSCKKIHKFQSPKTTVPSIQQISGDKNYGMKIKYESSDGKEKDRDGSHQDFDGRDGEKEKKIDERSDEKVGVTEGKQRKGRKIKIVKRRKAVVDQFKY